MTRRVWKALAAALFKTDASRDTCVAVGAVCAAEAPDFNSPVFQSEARPYTYGGSDNEHVPGAVLVTYRGKTIYAVPVEDES